MSSTSPWRLPVTESFEIYRKQREVDPEILKKLKKCSKKELLTKLNNMIELARKHLAAFDLENGLIYYWRGAEIGLHGNGHPDMQKDPDFVNKVSLCIREVENLDPVLKNLYIQHGTKTVKAENGEIFTRNTVMIYSKEYEMISSKEVVHILNNEKTILIIDIRERNDERVSYKNEQVLSILSLPPSTLPQTGLTFKTVHDNLPLQERQNLIQISHFEYVIFMGQEQFKRDQEILSRLLPGLFLYNHKNKPKRAPLIMDGGFDEWRTRYPSYVSGVKRKKTLFDGDDISKLIADLYKDRDKDYGDYSYPELSPPKPRDRSSFSPPSISPDRPTPSAPLFPDPSTFPPSLPPLQPPSQYPPQTPPQSSYPQIPGPSQPTVPSHNRPPIPSRTTDPFDPLASSSSSTSLQDEFKAAPQPAPRTTRPELNRGEKPVLQPRANAGGSSVSSTLSSHSSSNTVPRIDRSAKPSLSHEDQMKLMGLYDAVMRAIDSESHRGPSRPGLTGLFNHGNTCFMNATLQALLHTRQLQDIFTRENFAAYVNCNNRMGTKGVMASTFSALVDAIYSGRYSALRIKRFIGLFQTEVNSTLCDGRQHDAHEFQTFLLDALHEDTNKGMRQNFEQNYKGGEKLAMEGEDFQKKNTLFACSPVQKIFNLQTVSELRCDSCGETSVTFEESSGLSLELPEASETSLNSCLSNHFSVSRLRGEESWNCPRCRCPRNSTRTTTLWNLPEVVIIHLKRFSYAGSGYIKNQISVSFPSAGLDLSGHFNRYSKHRSPSSPYHLYAVVNHTGSLSSGHYTSIVKMDEAWIKCDDECLSNSDPSNISPSGAFIFFYRRST